MRLLVSCMKDGVVRFDPDQMGSSAQHLSSPVLTWTVVGVHLNKVTTSPATWWKRGDPCSSYNVSRFAFNNVAVFLISFLEISHALAFMFLYKWSRANSTDVVELLISLSSNISSSMFSISKCFACRNSSSSFSSNTSILEIPVLNIALPQELILVSRVTETDWPPLLYLSMEKSEILDLNS